MSASFFPQAPNIRTIAKLKTVRNLTLILPPGILLCNVKFLPMLKAHSDESGRFKNHASQRFTILLYDNIDSSSGIFQYKLFITTEYFFEYLFRHVVRCRFGFDDKVPIGKAVNLLTLVKQLAGGAFVAGERAFFLRIDDIEPAMI